MYIEPSAGMEPPVNFEPTSLNIELLNHTEPTMNIKPLPMKLEPPISEQLNMNIEHKEEKNIHQYVLGNQ